MQDGGKISASTIEGKEGGNITINAPVSVELTGTFRNEQRSSGFSVQTRGNGTAGDITINTGQLNITGGAEITASTFGEGNSGDITVNATESVTISDTSPTNQLFSRLIAETGGQLDPEDTDSSIGKGKGGDITINTQKLTVEDRGIISVSSQNVEADSAGELKINVDSLTLKNQGKIISTTLSGDGGNINLQIADVLTLRDRAEISTTAGTAQTGGDGGNIIIDSDFILAFPTSNKHEITAEAFAGDGGQIAINTTNILGAESINISASSNLGLDGTVSIETPDVDPTSGVVELTDVPVDAEAIFAQDLCRFEEGQIAKGSSFIITGRGGLTPTAEDSLNNIDNVVGWANRQDIDVSSNGTVVVSKGLNPETQTANNPVIQQSQGWVRAADGSVWLVANATQAVPQTVQPNHPDCNSIE